MTATCFTLSENPATVSTLQYSNSPVLSFYWRSTAKAQKCDCTLLIHSSRFPLLQPSHTLLQASGITHNLRGVSINAGTPKWMVYKFIRKIPIQMDDLGVFSFLETSISQHHAISASPTTFQSLPSGHRRSALLAGRSWQLHPWLRLQRSFRSADLGGALSE